MYGFLYAIEVMDVLRCICQCTDTGNRHGCTFRMMPLAIVFKLLYKINKNQSFRISTLQKNYVNFAHLFEVANGFMRKVRYRLM